MKKLHTKKWTEWRANVSQCRKTERGDPLRFFNIHSVAKHEKIEEKNFFYFREKISQCRKKLKRGLLWDFPTFILSQNIKKMQGGPFEEKKFRKKIRKKCLAVPKKIERGDPLRFFNIHSVAKHEKIEEKKFFYFREKILQCRKKTERRNPLGFSNIHSVAKHQKNAGGTL